MTSPSGPGSGSGHERHRRHDRAGRARGRHGQKANKPDPVVAGVRWLDDRLGVAKGGRTLLDKIFPDHWSFLLGEIALYSFVVLIATGIFLSLYFIPSAKEVIYHGPVRAAAGLEGVRRLRVDGEPLLRRAQRARHPADAPLGRGRVRRRHRRAHVPHLLHRRLPQAPRAQLDDRRHAAHPGADQRVPRVLAARRPRVGDRPAHHVLDRAVDPDRGLVPGHVPLRGELPRRRDRSSRACSSSTCSWCR